MKEFQARQGDIFLKMIDEIPEVETEQVFSTESRSIDGIIVLAWGEATGHKHAIRDKTSMLLKEKNGNRFFLVVVKPTVLMHEEHSEIKLPVGNYQVIRQREYTPTKIKYVAD